MIVPDVGGAFGTKGNPASEAIVAAIAAIDLGRPVKWTEDRLENLLDDAAGARDAGRHGDGARRAAGGSSACAARILADLGALPAGRRPTSRRTPPAMLMGGCYDVPAVAVEVTGARTQQGADRPVPRGGAARGQLLRRARRSTTPRGRSAIDPVELRRRNLVRDVPVPERRSGLTYDSGDYERCLRPRAASRRARAPRRRRASSSAPASRCTSSARAACSRAPTSTVGARRARRRPVEHVAARPGPRHRVRPDRRRPPRHRARRRRAALRRQRRGARRDRDVRQPVAASVRRLGGRARRRRGRREQARAVAAGRDD